MYLERPCSNACLMNLCQQIDPVKRVAGINSPIWLVSNSGSSKELSGLGTRDTRLVAYL